MFSSLPLQAKSDLRSGHRPMGLRLLKLIVCLLLSGPLASPGFGHMCVESPVRAGARVFRERVLAEGVLGSLMIPGYVGF